MINQTFANPYIGPRSFLPGERLYGRDRELRDLFGLLVAERIVLMYSPSGAGKTSLIQAALVPRLRDAEFAVLPVVRVGLEPPAEGARSAEAPAPNRYALSTLISLAAEPGAEAAAPLDTLAGVSLAGFLDERDRRRGKQDTVLIFDQFEEVLTVDPFNRAAKHEFFAQLGAALRDKRRWALFAMREDYVASLSPYLRPLPTRLGNTFHLDLLAPASALEAIREPAWEQGVDFTEAAATALVDDLRKASVQLPDGTIEQQLGPGVEPVQLQVVCYRLWQRLFGPEAPPAGDEPAILPEDLQGVADVDGSLAEYYAERVAAAAAESGVSERAIREWVDRQLITPLNIRSQVLRGAEASEGLPNFAIEPLVDAYLVRVEQRRGMAWIELAHDRLVGPVRANNNAWFAEHLSSLQRQADLWERQGRPRSLLFRDADLAAAEAWAAAHPGEAGAVEQTFLSYCRELRATAEREQRQNRRIRLLAWGASVVAALALAALGVAIFFYQEAERKERLAQIGQLAAAANNAIDFDPELAVILAREATLARVPGADRPEQQAVSALYRAVGASRVRQTFVYPDARTELTFSRDGVWLASGSASGAIDLMPLAGGDPRQLSGHTGAVLDISFSRDSSLLASVAAGDPFVLVWDLTNDASRRLTQAGAPPPIEVSFSPDGATIATAHGDDRVRFWDARAGGPPEELHIPGGAITAITFGPGDEQLAIGDANGVVRLVDLLSGDETRVETEKGPVADLDFNSDDTRLAITFANREPMVWDLSAGDELILLPGQNARVSDLDFARDSDRFATSSDDSTVRLYDEEYGVLLELRGHSRPVTSIAFSRQGGLLASAGQDGVIHLWDLNGAFVYPLVSLDVSPDGRTVVAGDDVGGVWLIDQASGAQLAQLSDSVTEVGELAFSGDGARVAVRTDEELAVWDVATRERIQSFDQRAGPIALDSGERLFVARRDALYVYDVASGAEQARIALGSVVSGLDSSPAGDRLAIVTEAGELMLWDVAAGREIARASEGFRGRAAFSPDGGRLAVRLPNSLLAVRSAADLSPLYTVEETAPVQVFAFSLDGATIALGSNDQTITLVDAASGARLAGWDEEYLARGLVFGPDDSLSVAGNDGSLRRYPLTLEGLLALADERITRAPTASECERFRLEQSAICATGD